MIALQGVTRSTAGNLSSRMSRSSKMRPAAIPEDDLLLTMLPIADSATTEFDSAPTQSQF